MSSVNSVHILGNVGRDPEVRYAPSGTAICSLAVATSRAWKDKTSGEKVEETEWHNVTLFDRQAEVAGEYLKKGSKVYIDGRLKTEKWQDKDGNDRYTTKIIASNLVLLDRKEQGGGEDRAPRQAAASRAPAPSRAPAQQRGGGSAPKTGTGFDNMDDDLDIPF